MKGPVVVFEGDRLKVLEAEDNGGGRFPSSIWITRGAFGSGEHETTAMCLRLLEGYDLAGRSALDLGTGTGILAIAALVLGCEKVVAVDPSSGAVEACRRNALLNGMEKRVVVIEGELSDLPPGSRFGLVMANLYGHLLEGLVPCLCEMLLPGGVMILSGMLYGEDFPIVTEAERGGVVVEKRLGGEEYLALGMRKVEASLL